MAAVREEALPDSDYISLVRYLILFSFNGRLLVLFGLRFDSDNWSKKRRVKPLAVREEAAMEGRLKARVMPRQSRSRVAKCYF